MELGKQFGGHVGDPPGDRGEGAHPGQHRGRAQGEHHCDRMISALIRAPIGDNCKALQQVNAFQRSRR
jgi:hypothetical protein